ncbi:histone chaperone Cia1 [Schizosaccharomyces japonicus yFS275]|uniref:Histone chaperone n=1 Tax=Schizosaccharomyces japonicus (strain yFS275 / FY16936) TaxID=402676 RepID=B6K418_SCHJY|nr:histone chaperone Cia1 [Schizosaccharomyces japonicus yFS275]EEB08225.1 histone chaperone Cia1 [Schizosaccharomyces japonicus yFS275]
MSIVNILSVNVLNNPAKFLDPYQFEITFECLEPLKSDLEWKLTYVGSATSQSYDQILDTLLVGPIPIGVNKFVFEADPPNIDLLPQLTDLLGVTVILLSCAYEENEFVRVGYYVNNEMEGVDLQEMEESEVKKIKVDVDKVWRNILAEKPRVTRFNIQWDNPDFDDAPPAQGDAEPEEEDEEMEEEEEEVEGEIEEEEEEEEEEEVEEEDDVMEEEDVDDADGQTTEQEHETEPEQDQSKTAPPANNTQ